MTNKELILLDIAGGTPGGGGCVAINGFAGVGYGIGAAGCTLKYNTIQIWTNKQQQKLTLVVQALSCEAVEETA